MIHSPVASATNCKQTVILMLGHSNKVRRVVMAAIIGLAQAKCIRVIGWEGCRMARASI